MTPTKTTAAVAAAGLAAAGLLIANLVVSATRPQHKQQNIVATIFTPRAQVAVPKQGDTLQAPGSCLDPSTPGCLNYPTTPAEVAPQPTEWGARVRMKGCGTGYSVTAKTGGKLLIVNSGSAARAVVSSDPPAKALVPTEWTLITWAPVTVATAYSVVYKAATCQKTNRIAVQVNPA